MGTGVGVSVSVCVCVVWVGVRVHQGMGEDEVGASGREAWKHTFKRADDSQA